MNCPTIPLLGKDLGEKFSVKVQPHTCHIPSVYFTALLPLLPLLAIFLWNNHRGAPTVEAHSRDDAAQAARRPF